MTLMDGWTDGQTDGPTDGQTLLQRCVDASKKEERNNKTFGRISKTREQGETNR